MSDTTPDWATTKEAGGTPDWAAPKAGLTTEEFDRLVPPTKTLPPEWTRDTTAGGPQLRTPGAAAGRQLGQQIGAAENEPVHEIPSFEIKPTDSRTEAVGKEAANLVIGAANFAQTPLGIETAPFGGVAPKTLMSIFGAVTLHDLGKRVLQYHKDWAKYSTPQKFAAGTDVAGEILMGTLLGTATVHPKAILNLFPQKVRESLGPVVLPNKTGTPSGRAPLRPEAEAERESARQQRLDEKGPSTGPATAPNPPKPAAPDLLKRVLTAYGAGSVTSVQHDGNLIEVKLDNGESRLFRKEQLKSEEPNASGIRSDTGQPGAPRKEVEGGESGGGANLQQPTPGPTPAPGAAKAQGAPKDANAGATGGNPPSLPHLTASGPTDPKLKANLDLLNEVMEDQHRELAGKVISERRAAGSERRRAFRRPVIGARADGAPDILDAIQEEGGLRPPPAEAGGEYDGYNEAMTGPARLLRSRTSKHGPDTMIQVLQAHGFENLKSPDDLWAAIKGAVAERAALPGRMENEKKVLAQRQKEFSDFSKSLNFHDEAVWAGSTKLADVKTGRKGNNIFIPTPEGADLPTEYQQHLVDRYGFQEGGEGMEGTKTPGVPTAAGGENAAPGTKGDVKENGKSAWFDAHGEEAKQKIFAAMRAIQERVDSAMEREHALRAPQGSISAGAASFDEFLKQESQAEVLRAVRKGAAPDQAVAAAKQYAREAVAKHNSKRPKDVNWARWEGTADTTIERAGRELKEAANAPAGNAVKPTAATKYGVPQAQWDEMANLTEAQQIAKYGTSRARLMEKAMVEKYGRPAGRVEGMGSRPKSTSRTAAEQSGRVMRERAQASEAPEATKELKAAVDTEMSGAGEAPAAAREDARGPQKKWFVGLRGAFNPMSLDESAAEMATILRYTLGKQFKNEQRFDVAMGKFRALFDRATTPRGQQYQEDAPLPPNWEIQRAIDSGDVENLTPAEAAFAGSMRQMFDTAIAEIQKFKPDVLQDLHESYFPRAWVKADGSDATDAALRLTRAHRPWMGPKTFLKARTVALWDDALARGLKPKWDNPVDAAYMKLAEMWRFAGALEAHGIAKARGIRRFRYIFERAPEGWTSAAPDDPSTKVYAPPFVTVKEAYDEMLRVKTLELLKSLGIPNERLMSLGGKRWGLAYESPENIKTKFGGPDFVFWHEFGHIMDFRFPDLRQFLGLKGGGAKEMELRKLADERMAPGAGEKMRLNKKTGKMEKARTSYGAYVRRGEEKMANIFHAYLHAPDLFQRVAPNVWSAFNRWLAKHPEVSGPLNDIRPSLRLGTAAKEQFAGGPILLGEWIMPEGAARVLQNYLAPSVWGKVRSLSAIKKIGGMMSNVRLISLFHGQMVSNDALASGLSLPLYDAMKAVADRNPALLKRAAKDFFLAPARPGIALAQGSRILKIIRGGAAKPGMQGDLDREIAQYAMDANLRAGHIDHVDNATRRFKQALFEAGNALKSGSIKGAAAPAWQAFYEAPFAISHEMMRPVMEWFVPRMKYGLFAPMAMRVMRDNPGADEMTLRRLMGRAADSVEDRVGQVTYDNMFLSKAVKDSGQLGLQAFGWHATKERMLWGSASDYWKAGRALLDGRKPEITFRMAYLPAMVVTHALTGGALMYALTGRRPKTLLDYLFPETGLVDQYGKPVRMALADFMKDYLSEYDAIAQGPKAEAQLWERRLMPVWNDLADMYRNRDFWNTQIFSQRRFDQAEWQHLWDNFKEGAAYLAGNNAPFSVKGAERFSQALPANAAWPQEALATGGPYFGFVPAPQALTQSAAETRAAELMRAGLPAMTREQSQHALLTAQLVHDLRTGKLNDEGQFVARARAAGIKDKAELTRVRQRVAWTPLQYEIYKLPLYQPGGGDAFSVWDLMSENEKRATAPFYREKLEAAVKGRRMDADLATRLYKVILPYLAKPKAAAPTPAQAQPANVLSKY